MMQRFFAWCRLSFGRVDGYDVPGVYRSGRFDGNGPSVVVNLDRGVGELLAFGSPHLLCWEIFEKMVRFDAKRISGQISFVVRVLWG